MACIISDENKKIIQGKYFELADKNTSLADKIELIKEMREISGSPSLLNDELAQIVAVQDLMQYSSSILTKGVELEYAEEYYNGKEKKKKRVESKVILDGDVYTLIHAYRQIRVFKNGGSKEFEIYFDEERATFSGKGIKERNTILRSMISDTMVKRIDSKAPGTDTSLPQRIMNELRKMYELDGETLPLERQLFKAEDDAGLFAQTENIFTDTNPELVGDVLTEIKGFINKTTREILFGKEGKDTTQNDIDRQAEFVGQFKEFLTVIKDMDVPKEDVWEQHYELKPNGDYVAVGTKYIAPNYLGLIGEYRPVKVGDKTHYSLVLDSQVDEIIKFYAIKTMADMNQLKIDMQEKNEQEISLDLGITVEEAKVLQDNFVSQGIVPIAAVIGESAQDAFSQLGLKVNKNINLELKEGILATFSSLIKATLAESKYAEHINSQTKIEAEKKLLEETFIYNPPLGADGKSVLSKEEQIAERKKLLHEGYNDIETKYNVSPNKTFSLFKINDEAFRVKETETRKDQYGQDVEHNITSQKDVFTAINKLKYLSKNTHRALPSAIPFTDIMTMMINSNAEITPKNLAFIKEQSQLKWEFKEDFKEFYEFAKEDKYGALKRVGWQELDAKTQHVYEMNKIKAINDSIERELDFIMEMYQTQDFVDNGFYLKWGQTKSGRPTLVTDMNPQESKMIRSMIQQQAKTETDYTKSGFDGHASTLTSEMFNDNSETNEYINILEVAMSQSLDMDPDKNSKRTVLAAIRDIINIHGDSITFNEDENSKGYELSQTIKSIVTGSAKGDDLTNAYATLFHAGEGNHGVQAARMLKRLNTWKNDGMNGDFNNDLTVETDAITSGMMLTLMQIMSSSSIEFLAKGGIYTDKTMARWTDYTKTLLAVNYKTKQNDIRSLKEIQDSIDFDPSSLIEAGNYHQTLLEDNEALHEALSAIEDEIGTEAEDFNNFLANNEVFNDLYKTIGASMKSKVLTKQVEISELLNDVNEQLSLIEALIIKAGNSPGLIEEIKAQYKYDLLSLNAQKGPLEIAEAMLNSIGTMNAKTLRSIAKSPVMTYVYGSKITSIKKSLAFSVGLETFLSDVKNMQSVRLNENRTQKDVDSYVKSSKYVGALLLEYERLYPGQMQYFKYDESGAKVRLSKDEIDAMDLDSLRMHIDVDDKMIKILQKATDMTFGNAIESAFKENFTDIDDYRNTVKSIELLSFELFNAQVETKKRNAMVDGVLTKAAFDILMKDLYDNGFGHDVPTGKADGKANRLPLEKVEQVGEGKSASVVVTFDKNPKNEKERNRQRRIYTLLKSHGFTANPGAAPTTSIHQLDGVIMVKAISDKAWLTIYDAIVQASNPNNVYESNKAYNINTITTTANRDIIHNNMAKLTHMLEDLFTRKASKDDKVRADANREYASIRSNFMRAEKVKKKFVRHIASSKKNDIKETTEIMSINGVKRTSSYLGDTYQYTHKETLTIEYNNGKKTVKEQYYKMFKGKPVIAKTVVTEYDGTLTHVTETYKYKKSTYKQTKNDDVENTSPIFGLRHSYTLYDGDDAVQTTDDKGAPIEFDREYVELYGSNSLPSVIHKEEMSEKTGAQKLDTVAILPSKNGANLAGHIGREKLPLDIMQNYIAGINDVRKLRFKALNQKFSSAHAALPGDKPFLVSNQMEGKTFVKNELSEALKLVDNFLGNTQKHETSYLLTSIDGVYDRLSDIYQLLIKDKIINDDQKILIKKQIFSIKNAQAKLEYASELINGTSGSIEFIGAGSNDRNSDIETDPLKYSDTTVVGKIFQDIQRKNTGAYTENSVVILSGEDNLDTRYNPVDRYGNLVGGFASLKDAIEAGSTIITDNKYESQNDSIFNYLQARGISMITDAKVIKDRLKNDKKKTNDAGNKWFEPKGSYRLGEIQLQNYLESNGYVYTKVDGKNIGVWKQANIEYNDKIKNANILAEQINMFLKENVNQC